VVRKNSESRYGRRGSRSLDCAKGLMSAAYARLLAVSGSLSGSTGGAACHRVRDCHEDRGRDAPAYPAPQPGFPMIPAAVHAEAAAQHPDPSRCRLETGALGGIMRSAPGPPMLVGPSRRMGCRYV
jgi:hypothetical protein